MRKILLGLRGSCVESGLEPFAGESSRSYGAWKGLQVRLPAEGDSEGGAGVRRKNRTSVSAWGAGLSFLGLCHGLWVGSQRILLSLMEKSFQNWLFGVSFCLIVCWLGRGTCRVQAAFIFPSVLGASPACCFDTWCSGWRAGAKVRSALINYARTNSECSAWIAGYVWVPIPFL